MERLISITFYDYSFSEKEKKNKHAAQNETGAVKSIIFLDLYWIAFSPFFIIDFCRCAKKKKYVKQTLFYIIVFKAIVTLKDYNIIRKTNMCSTPYCNEKFENGGKRNWTYAEFFWSPSFKAIKAVFKLKIIVYFD